MNTINAVRDTVLFQFCDAITKERFVNKTSSGLIISSQDVNQSSASRWGKVTHVGPDVVDVKPGDYVLVEAGKWTVSFDIDGQRYWKTDPNQIMALGDEPATVY